MNPIIQIQNLTKYYGSKRALENLNLEVRKGEIFGFLGPNGAGKTTTIRILLDLIRPTEGSATIFGLDVHKDSVAIKKKISYLPSEFGLYGHLKVGDFLKYFNKFPASSINGSLIPSYAERFELDLNKKIKDLSHGMKQKTAIVLAFVKDPVLYIFDEPTQGLDPLMQEEFYQALLEQRERGRSIFFSSHVLSEVERICDRCAIIRKGNLVEVETIQGLKEKKMKKIEILFDEEPSMEEWQKFPGVHKVEKDRTLLRIYTLKNPKEILKKVCEGTFRDITVEDPNLEEVFLEYYREEEQ